GDKDAAFDKAISENVYHSIKLNPTHGFYWEREEIDKVSSEDGVPPPTGWINWDNFDD
ncbi:hypothetical protein A2U01_0108637, partial [Trifolium medium]|nr:hypothetical protein [Trifolium medium]